MKSIVRLSILSVFIFVTACNSPGDFETRTIRLQHLRSDEAVSLIMPYVDLEKGMVYDSQGRLNTITVRASEEALQQIESILFEYDQPPQVIQLHFQLIEADGFTDSEPAIADVESALRELFRFEGYRLIDQAVIQTTSNSRMAQSIGGIYTIEGNVRTIQHYVDDVELEVRLSVYEHTMFATTLNIHLDQTIILGNAQRGESTIILTVRPELAE